MAGTQITILGSLGGQNETQLNGGCCRAGTAVAIVVDGETYLLDCGLGTVSQLLKAGIELSTIRHVFITHHHADHNADLSTLLVLAYTSGAEPITVHGPSTNDVFVSELATLHAPTIECAELLGQRPFTQQVSSVEYAFEGPITQGGVRVHDDPRVSVIAKVVDHGQMPSVAYRFTTADRDVTFSGDTGGHTNIAQFALGSDTLVHEVIDYGFVYAGLLATQGGASQKFLDHLKNDHSSPEVCGTTATAAEVGTLVLYHLIPGTLSYPAADWHLQVRPFYSGELVIATDLLQI